VVEWKSLYVHSIWDNGSGNWNTTSEVERYLNVFPELRTAAGNNFDISGSSAKARALWAVMLALQTKKAVSPTGSRLVFCDNFYTSVDLAVRLRKLTDGELLLCGTVKMTNLDSENRTNIREGLSFLAGKERYTFCIVQAKRTDDQQANRNKRRRRANQQPQGSTIVENAGFVIWKDKKGVTFFTNDLTATPSTLFLSGESAEAKRLVRGMLPVQRWVGDENLNRSIVQVPSTVAAYKSFMNSVDRMDQLRAASPTRRRESRVYMSLLSWIMDIAINNGLALYNELRTTDSSLEQLTMEKFKLSIIEGYVLRGHSSSRIPQQIVIDITPNDVRNHLHYLLKSTGARPRGFVCMTLGNDVKVLQYCSQCKRGFQTNCYSLSIY